MIFNFKSLLCLFGLSFALWSPSLKAGAYTNDAAAGDAVTVIASTQLGSDLSSDAKIFLFCTAPSSNVQTCRYFISTPFGITGVVNSTLQSKAALSSVTITPSHSDETDTLDAGSALSYTPAEGVTTNGLLLGAASQGDLFNFVNGVDAPSALRPTAGSTNDMDSATGDICLEFDGDNVPNTTLKYADSALATTAADTKIQAIVGDANNASHEAVLALGGWSGTFERTSVMYADRFALGYTITVTSNGAGANGAGASADASCS